MEHLTLSEAIKIVETKFKLQTHISNYGSPTLIFNYLFKAEFQNQYVALRDIGKIGVTFFKSNRKNELIIDDLFDIGIEFYPESIEDLKTIIKSIDA